MFLQYYLLVIKDKNRQTNFNKGILNQWKINKNITLLISELEYIIGNQFYNPRSYNGYTGEEGAEFRYPINVYRDNKLSKTWSKVTNLTANEIDTLRYQFGANHLYIGRGLVKVLEYIEERYGINFNELEEKLDSDN